MNFRHGFSKTATLLAVCFLGSLPARAYTHTFCIDVRVTTTDSGIGEDTYATPGAIMMPARGAHVRVLRNGATVVGDTYASQGGCLTFDSPHTTNFQLEMWSDAEIPRTDNTNYSNFVRVLFANGTQAYWNWFIDNPGGGVVHVATNQTRRSNLLGLATYAVARWSDGLVNRTITVRDEECPSIPGNSCANGGTAYIQPASNEKKFLVGHELGHVLVHLWLDDHVPTSYSVNSGGSFCETDAGMAHALHSKEHQSAAFNEGFAQVYSTAVWNLNSQTDGWFHYYKDTYKDGAVTEVDVENGPTGGVTAYLETRCTGSDAGYGVELDWQRAFWDYLTNDGEKPTHYQLLRQLKNAVIGGSWSNANAYGAFTDAIADYDADNGTDFFDRWIDFAAYNGVDH